MTAAVSTLQALADSIPNPVIAMRVVSARRARKLRRRGVDVQPYAVSRSGRQTYWWPMLANRQFMKKGVAA